MTSKDKSRRSASKGEDASANRTGEGVAFGGVDPVEVYTPGLVESGTFFKFKKQHLDFLKEYAKDLDEVRAAAEVGIAPRTLARWMDTPALRNEVEEIHRVWKYNVRMTAEHSAGRHIRLFDQFENDYEGADPELRAKMMNPLAKMSETYLRAAGHFTHGGISRDTNITINIDLGDDKGVVIDG